VQAINACNQRGGRMLSLVDLIDAETVDLSVASYLAAVMRHGASLIVGARPGGAGKTTVMCALLNFLPDHTAIRPVDGPLNLRTGNIDQNAGSMCYLAHEIGAGPYYAYVWGEQARKFFHLASCGHLITSNLHADTLEETRDQLVRQNGIAPADLSAVQLKVYLRVERAKGWAVKRRVSHVYESNNHCEQLIWQRDADGAIRRQTQSSLVSAAQEDAYGSFLYQLLQEDTRRIEQVRLALLKRS
jgi:hypothetical protein